MYGDLNDSASQYTEVTKKIDLNAMATRYNEDPVITNNIWKPGRITAQQNYSKYCQVSYLFASILVVRWLHR